ncbi:glycosyltransferase [Clostridium sporogenes]|nr:glycosyltransferase [Clostridium sporogenes]
MDTKDLIDIIKYYSNHEEKRQEIILNDYEKVKDKHTYDKRLKGIIKTTKNT